MLGWKYGVGLVALLGVACSGDEEAPSAASADASAGGSSGATTGGSGGSAAVRGSGGRAAGGTGGRGAGAGTGGANGGAGGAGGATNGGRDASAPDGSIPDGSASDSSVRDGTADTTDSVPVDAGCRGTAASICATGSWRKYGADGGATCAACPGPTLTCAGFDLAASSFIAANPKRIIKVALASEAAEVLLDDDVRITATFQGSSCGGNPAVTTFGKNGITVEHDAAGRTFLSVDIGLINTTMVPCGDVRFVFNDGCCMPREVHVSAVYDDGSGTTTFSCVDAG